MKAIIPFFISLLLSCTIASSQSLNVFGIDTSSFPVMKAKFYAIDSNNKQIRNLSVTDFAITENGANRKVLSVSCPPESPPSRLSSVLVLDVSGSMSGLPLDIEKKVANTWVNNLPLGQSECCITSFNGSNYFNQDFTTNRNKLLNAINGLTSSDGTNYNAAMLDMMAGGILAAKTGKYKKAIIFLTDGMPNFYPDETTIINDAKANGITIYCITIRLPAHQSMKNFADNTGGLWYEKVSTVEEAEKITREILMRAQSSEPCDIEWESGISCASNYISTEFKLIPFNITTRLSYQSPSNVVAKLELNPASLKLLRAMPGIKKDTTITITAKNSDFTVTNITSSNPAFTITPSSFFLASGNSKILTVSFIPADSGYVYTKFNIENDKCQTIYYASGGFPGVKPKIQTLKLIKPNGAEQLVAGTDTVITWEGILPDEPVKIEYSTNSGASWTNICDSATGLSYKWRVPNTPSYQCLARVTAKTQYIEDYESVQICNQIWMVKNLEVDHYRNGDLVRFAATTAEWQDANSKKEGAWCYYNNNSTMGPIYGKTYNWYAVNDPRGLAPFGWHIPSDDEWKILEACIGMTQTQIDGTSWRGTIEGGKLKAIGTVEAGSGLWYSPN
ncbi:MAG: hypothetical protein QG635_987, partial [Bacteroidota bacterium]|nr:hypothetical protein [Bacteroidota bacterium]